LGEQAGVGVATELGLFEGLGEEGDVVVEVKFLSWRDTVLALDGLIGGLAEEGYLGLGQRSTG